MIEILISEFVENTHLVVEVGEEDQEGEHVQTARVLHPHREVAPDPDGVDAHHQGSHELGHLQPGEYIWNGWKK